MNPEMKIKYLEVLVMPNDEILCLGKIIGLVSEYKKYIHEIPTKKKKEKK